VLNLSDAPNLTLEELSRAGNPFDVNYGYLDPVSEVQVFNGAIGKDGEIICCGDFVKITPSFNEVRTDMINFYVGWVSYKGGGAQGFPLPNLSPPPLKSINYKTIL